MTTSTTKSAADAPSASTKRSSAPGRSVSSKDLAKAAGRTRRAAERRLGK